jgi:hypothetical protein
MKTFNYWWKFSGLQDYHNRGTIEASNLPHALEQLAELEGFRVSGTRIKQHRSRRLYFVGLCTETHPGKFSAPLVEGIIAKA